MQLDRLRSRQAPVPSTDALTNMAMPTCTKQTTTFGRSSAGTARPPRSPWRTTERGVRRPSHARFPVPKREPGCAGPARLDVVRSGRAAARHSGARTRARAGGWHPAFRAKGVSRPARRDARRSSKGGLRNRTSRALTRCRGSPAATDRLGGASGLVYSDHVRSEVHLPGAGPPAGRRLSWRHSGVVHPHRRRQSAAARLRSIDVDSGLRLLWADATDHRPFADAGRGTDRLCAGGERASDRAVPGGADHTPELPCSIIFGKGVGSAAPGSADGTPSDRLA